jgi:hypothetical protein
MFEWTTYRSTFGLFDKDETDSQRIYEQYKGENVSPWTSIQGGRTVPRGQEQSHEVTYPHVARVCGLQRHCIQQAFHLHDRDKDGHRPGRLSKHRPFRCGPQALRSRRGEPSHVIISPRGRYVLVDVSIRLGMASTMLCLQVSAFESLPPLYSCGHTANSVGCNPTRHCLLSSMIIDRSVTTKKREWISTQR